MRTFLKLFSIIAAAAMFQNAVAQPSEEQAIDDAIACRDITDDLQRLACLDAAAETLSVTRIIREEAIVEKKREEKENFGLAGRDDDDDERVADVTETPEEFGGEYLSDARKEREDKRLKSITGKVAEVRVNQFGKVTLTLENGQVWRQLDSDNKRLYFSDDDKLYTAKVKRSLFGNYMLTVNEMKRTIRVRRIE